MRRIQLFRPTYRVKETTEAVRRVLKEGWTGLGPETKLYEQELANYLESKHVIFLNSATAGLHLSLKLLNLKPGQKVITTPLTFVSTNHVILYESLEPIFCDVRLETGCMDERKIENLITEDVGAIIVVHYSGVPANMDEINEVARTYNLPVIEDCCHAFGSEYKGRKLGNSSNLCVHSFHAVKPSPIGEGGAISTNNRLYYERLQKLRWMGIDKSTYIRNEESGYSWEYNVEEVGYKYAGNDILAAIGRVSLKYAEEDDRRRQEIVDKYREDLGEISWLRFVPGISHMDANPGLKSANHLCVIRVPKKKEFVERMKERGVDVGCHYTPNYYYPMYWVDGKVQILENTEKLYKEIVTLPLHLKLTDADVKYIIKTIKEVWD